MTADRWTHLVRRQLSLGRLLPLGREQDGAWLAESAACQELRQVADALAGVRLDALRVGPVDGAPTGSPAVPPPPSALPPGPLSVTARFAAVGPEPLPAGADRLRGALLSAARERLGLDVTEVDLHVTELLDGGDGTGAEGGAGPGDPGGEGPAEGDPVLGGPATTGSVPGLAFPPDRHTSTRQEQHAAEQRADDEETRVARAAEAVAGVARLTGTLGGLGRAVHIDAPEAGSGAASALPRRHVRIEIAAVRGHRTLDVARAVRGAVGAALPDAPSVAVVVTAID